MYYPVANKILSEFKDDLVYLAGAYSHSDPAMMQQRFEELTLTSAILVENGVVNISPITQSHEQARVGRLPGDWAFWERVDKVFLDKCDVMFILNTPGWKESVGVTAEIEYAKGQNKSIYLINLENDNV